MAFHKWTLLYLAVFLLLPSIGNTDAQSCGGNYTDNYGVFMSPNYPNVYNISNECTYTISLSTISSITLVFETFELDRSPGDFVLISCESNSGFVQKNYTWDYNIPPISIPWCSSGRLVFYSDSLQPYSTRGFRVQYQVSTRACFNTVFTSSSGIISSPNYPQNYNNNENCTYSIWAQETSSFTLTFQAFSLESDCTHDWVQIRCDNSSYILPKYCGTALPKPAYISNCKKVLIWFHTDQSNVFSGFSLQYSNAPEGCAKLSYAGLSGMITSPNYPKGYNKITCTYYVYPVSSVALDFQSFDLEPFIDNDDGDYLMIDCESNYSYPYSYYRGNTLPPLISYSKCSRVRLYFYTNNAISGTGFSVKYQVNPLVPHSAITNAPKNIAAYRGSQVKLYCTSNATGHLPSWTWSRDGMEENTVVIASFCVVNSGYLKYSAEEGGPGVCNLVINSATLAEAGVYTCTDVSLASFSSVVSIVDVVPNVIREYQLVKGDIITFEYYVKFNGSVAPAPILPMLYSWNSTGKSSAISNITLPNIIISSINVTAEPEVVPSYGFKLTFSAPINRKDYATNAPVYSYTKTTDSYTGVLYWPEESNMTITGDNNGYIAYNGLLQCTVVSNPYPTYYWRDHTNGISSYGYYLHVTHSGEYTCNTSNVIRDKTYWASKSIILYIQVETTDSNDVVIVLAVLVAIFGFGYIGIAIFWIVRRGMLKEEDQRNTYQDFQDTRHENIYTTISAPTPANDDIPIRVLSPSCSGTADEC